MTPLEILQNELKTLQRKVLKCNEQCAKIRRLIYSKHLSPEAAALFKNGTIARQGAEEWAALKANEKTYTDWADEYGCAIAVVEEMIRELNGVPEFEVEE
ncbi:uncharacterized protein H6S33_005252 [Morchella sextelata]|uniref:uncharacterized protein n=1 Tax=Morchella sextelata TaxID=1174677 RepID=UPI001D049F2A|nr:uncharacterized protein H6S33_005252 [Morchella sextelata]KAH0605270.1 hypothetical protein H6S33_005252 [Morchella sextelata]